MPLASSCRNQEPYDQGTLCGVVLKIIEGPFEGLDHGIRVP